MTLEITVTQKRENGVLGRTEVHFTASHPNEGTPTRADLRKALAGQADARGGVVILDWARSEFGRATTRGYARIYMSKERAMELETPPILIRNGLMQAVKKEAAPKEAPAAPPKREAAPPGKEEKPKVEAPKPEPAKKEERKEHPKKDEKPEPPKKEERKEAPPREAKKEASKEEAPKEKKPAAKKEGK